MRATRSNRSLRLLDRYAGIPLMSLFAAMPKRRALPRELVRRIGVLKTAAIGDTLLLSGPLQDLRRAYPDAAIVMITGSDNRGAAQLLPGRPDEFFVVSPHRPLEAISAIRAAKLSVLLDFGSWPRFDALLATLSGAAFRVGFRTPGQGRHFGYDLAVDHLGTEHELANYRRLIAAVGVTGESMPHVSPPGVLASERLPPSPFVVFHPWSGGFNGAMKEWPNARWVELGCRLGDRHVLVSCGPADGSRSRKLAEELTLAGCSARVGEFTLPELADVLAASEVVVSVNTGVMHLATLVGARTVSLEGPTPAWRWGPIGPRVRHVESVLPGCGYLNLGFEYSGRRRDCMEGISVDAVFAAIGELVATD